MIDPTNTAIDPISRCHALLWNILTQPPATKWSTLVQAANRFDQTNTDDALRERILQGREGPVGFEKFMIRQGDFASGKMNIREFSWLQTFKFSIASDKMEVVDLNELKFVTLATLFAVGGPVLNAPGFVKGWMQKIFQDFNDEDDAEREGETSVGSIVVELYLTPDQLANFI